ncbi:MAG: hypothetical protein LCH37_13430 [Bacteroidetes bacterium]|nr:hypothetical protein [Bacteroidota bacterium]
MPEISKKKIPVPVGAYLRNYLKHHHREMRIGIEYRDLMGFSDSIALYDKKGKDTLWETCMYPHEWFDELQRGLIEVYALMKAGGDIGVMEHLFVDRIDNCLYGNTSPFRIRIVNRINDNFDYFYVKKADASRILGLELEHLLSPNRIHYLVHNDTLIEEHIAGVPGDAFLKLYQDHSDFNPIRLSKEFIKFNERCFIKLLGDMHSSNFVIQLTPDFEEVHYRIRAIDFDQQCYEGKKTVYLPQYYKQNNPYVELGMKYISVESMKQYQREERAMMINRMKAAKWPLVRLIEAMSRDPLAPEDHVRKLRQELSEHYKSSRFERAGTMGGLLRCSLMHLLSTTSYIRKNHL